METAYQFYQKYKQNNPQLAKLVEWRHIMEMALKSYNGGSGFISKKTLENAIYDKTTKPNLVKNTDNVRTAFYDRLILNAVTSKQEVDKGVLLNHYKKSYLKKYNKLDDRFKANYKKLSEEIDNQKKILKARSSLMRQITRNSQDYINKIKAFLYSSVN